MRHQGVSLLKGGAFTIYAIFKLLPKQRKLVLISRLNTKTSIDFQQIVQDIKQAHKCLHIKVTENRSVTYFLYFVERLLALSNFRYVLEKSHLGGVA